MSKKGKYFVIVAHIINFMLLGFIRSNWRRHPSQVKHVAGWFIQWSQLATTDVLRFIGAWSQNDSIWSLLVERCQCFAVVSKREGSQQIEQAALPSEEMPLLLRSQIHDVSRIDQYLTCIVLCNLYTIIIYNDNDFYMHHILLIEFIQSTFLNWMAHGHMAFWFATLSHISRQPFPGSLG